MLKITVIGSFVMDHVAVMSRFPQVGETVLGESISLFPGGKGANQCVAIARLWGDVEMVGMIGKDSNGEIFKKILREEGICAEHVFLCDKPTAVAQVQLDQNGQNRICVIPSANYEFGYAELDLIDGTLRNTEIVVVQLELRLDVTEELIRRAHRYGKRVILNPAPAAPLSEELLACVDIITPNEKELAFITGMPTDTDEELVTAARRLREMGANIVVATLGGRGALVCDGTNVEIVSGFAVKVVDTVAAGDSFNGALAVALSEGKSLRESVCFANAMGALTVQQKGAIPSLHTRRELETFLSEHIR